MSKKKLVMVRLWYGYGTKAKKKLGALDLQGLRKCGKQDLKLLLYDFRLSPMFPYRLVSTLSRFWTFLTFPIPSQTVRDF